MYKLFLFFGEEWQIVFIIYSGIKVMSCCYCYLIKKIRTFINRWMSSFVTCLIMMPCVLVFVIRHAVSLSIDDLLHLEDMSLVSCWLLSKILRRLDRNICPSFNKACCSCAKRYSELLYRRYSVLLGVSLFNESWFASWRTSWIVLHHYQIWQLLMIMIMLIQLYATNFFFVCEILEYEINAKHDIE